MQAHLQKEKYSYRSQIKKILKTLQRFGKHEELKLGTIVHFAINAKCEILHRGFVIKALSWCLLEAVQLHLKRLACLYNVLSSSLAFQKCLMVCCTQPISASLLLAYLSL